ncbi:MAG: nucleoside deaminase [Omnitrophica WOR_2 bacterium]
MNILEEMDMHQNFMAEAIKMAEINLKENNGGPFGAVIVKDGTIIATGSNMVTLQHDPTAHAEIVAIRNACSILKDFQLSGCDIYCSCEPCPMCLGALYWARPNRIFYAATRHDAATAGFDDDFIYKELVKDHGDRKIATYQLMREESMNVFKNWADLEKKLPY